VFDITPAAWFPFDEQRLLRSATAAELGLTAARHHPVDQRGVDDRHA
jgi:hypothetical protein